VIPLRDANPSGTWPLVTVAVILANVAAFVHELGQGPALDRFLLTYGLVPVKVVYLWQIAGLGLLGDVVIPAFASIFLHGGFVHLLGNMWYLWIFGDNIEDRLGHLRFLVFYLLCGLLASAAHVALNPESGVPVIGASGAIAGVLGAYLVCFPRARVLTLVPIFIFVQFVQLPAFVLLLFWFVLQFFNGALAIGQANLGGVAWWAHIGGFVAGMVLVWVFPRRRGARQTHYHGWRG
jgi:membrane associated rhomboid family serine protease